MKINVKNKNNKNNKTNKINKSNTKVKLSKVLEISLLFILILLTLGNSIDLFALSASEINGYSVGTSFYMPEYHTYANTPNMYCTNEGKLIIGNSIYKVTHKFSIKGNVATDKSTGKEVTAPENLELAYILGQPNTHVDSMCHNNSVGEHIVKECGQVQLGIWNYMKTWQGAVGSKLGIPNAYIETSRVNSNLQILKDARNYRNTFNGESTNSIKDNTNISSITINKSGEKLVIGPFNYGFAGTLSSISLIGDNGKAISGSYIAKYVGNNLNKVNPSSVNSGENIYIVIPGNTDMNNLKKAKVKVKANITTYDVDVTFVDNGWEQPLIAIIPSHGQKEIESDFNYSLTGKIKIVKVNKDDHQVKLPNVSFILRNDTIGKYVKETKGVISYVSSQADATKFLTNKDGVIQVDNILIGKYTAYETNNPNYGYEATEDANGNLIIKAPFEIKSNSSGSIVVENRQERIKISGFVWEDYVNGKQSYRNNVFDGVIKDDNNNIYELADGSTDKLKPGVTVILMKDGKEIARTVTNENGVYQFKDLAIREGETIILNKYSVVFEYDGLIYENLDPVAPSDINPKNNDNNLLSFNELKTFENKYWNQSKSAEDIANNYENRDRFNKRFETISGAKDNAQSKGFANGDHELNYNFDNEFPIDKNLDKDKSYYDIRANTTNTTYNIKPHFRWGLDEVKYINLGLCKREQPDLSMMKDVDNVVLTINNKEFVYPYASKTAAVNKEKPWNAENTFGIQYGSRYNPGTYKRPIYEADMVYEGKSGNPRLEAYITYRVRLINESTNLKARINEFSDYYDNRLEFVGASYEVNTGTKLNKNVTAKDLGAFGDSNMNRVSISTNNVIDSQKYLDVFLQFKVIRSNDQTKDNLIKMVNENGLDKDINQFINVVEIDSYSILKDRKGKDVVYAGIDKDSNPGNINPGNVKDTKSYQDDTDFAPGFALVLAPNRTISGTVFIDESDKDFNAGAERFGNGVHDNGEKGVKDVVVNFVETSGSGKVYKATTNGNGQYNITEGFIPGDYVIVYTWGDNEISVDKYKSTIVDEDIWNKKLVLKNKWYRDAFKKDIEKNVKYSDALDVLNSNDSIGKNNKGTEVTLDMLKDIVNNEDYVKNTYTRNVIDKSLETIDNNKTVNPTKINSLSPILDVGIEMDDSVLKTEEGSKGITYKFNVTDADLGIVKRPIQNLQLDKNVCKFVLRQADGTPMVEALEGPDGKLEIKSNFVTHVGKNNNTVSYPNGWIKAELDNEIIHGANLEVAYKITTTNLSELDFINGENISRNYYYFNKVGSGDKLVSMSAENVVDYLDKGWSVNTELNTTDGLNWEPALIKGDKLEYDKKGDKPESDKINRCALDSNVRTSDEIKDKLILVTEDLADKKLRPEITNNKLKDKLNNVTNGDIHSASTKLNVSKMLASTDDIHLQNSTEIIKISKDGGSTTLYTPGNYKPDSGSNKPYGKVEGDDSMAETVIVTGNTGANKNFVTIGIVAIVSLAIIGAGAYIIKKKVL